jgi:hypothetical protein
MLTTLKLIEIILLCFIRLLAVESCIHPFNGFDLSPLSSKPYWIFRNEIGFNFFPGQTKNILIYASFCKNFENYILVQFVLILKDLPVCNGSSACLFNPNLPSESVVIGNYTTNPFVSTGNYLDYINLFYPSLFEWNL